eukprot:67164-Pelagomonas_calceolata.AAC.1
MPEPASYVCNNIRPIALCVVALLRTIIYGCEQVKSLFVLCVQETGPQLMLVAFGALLSCKLKDELMHTLMQTLMLIAFIPKLLS